MPTLSPAAAAGILLLACAASLGPGWAVLRLAGLRGQLAVALAPACSIALLGSGAVLAPLLGLGWGPLPALAVPLVAAAVAAVVGRRASAPPAPPVGRLDVVAVLAGLLLCAVPVLVAADWGEPYLQRWDAVFHLSALRLVEETGSASSLTLGALSYGDARAAVYPAGWHALASLLPGPPTAVLTLTSTVTASLPWVLGSAVLAHELTPAPHRRGVAGVAALLAGVATSTPTSLWVGWGHVPNAAGLAMLPAAVALGLRVLREPRGRPVAVVALLLTLLGMGLAHPNSVLATSALLAPALVAAVVTATRRALAVAAAATAAAVVAAFLLSPLASAVTGYAAPGSTSTVVDAVVDVVTGQYVLWPTGAGAVLAALAVVGAVLAARGGVWLGPAMLAVSWLLYVDAATGGHLLLSRPWYTSAARLSVVVTAVAVPLAAVAVVAGVAWLRRRATVAGAAVTVAALAAALLVPTLPMRVDRTDSRYETAPGHPPQFVTDGELAMIAALPGRLDGTVLGSPFSGAASAYGLAGVPVVFPVAGQVWSADQQLVMDHLDPLADGTAPPEVCAAVERLGIRYLYQDTAPYQVDHRYEPLDRLVIAGAEVVAEADTARVIRLPAC